MARHKISLSITSAALCWLFVSVGIAAVKKNPLLEIDFKKYSEGLGNDMIVEKMDSTNKGRPDMITVFKKGNNQERILSHQLFDFNRDGKIDMAAHFQKGKRIRTEFDLDYDGKVDSVSEFSLETGELLKKTLVESDTLLWKYWHKGELRRKEVDRNGDGEPDLWVHYRNGRVVKSEIDVNFDGKNIRVESDLTKSQ